MLALLKTKIGMAIAGGAAVFVLALGALFWWLASEIATLETEIRELERKKAQVEAALSSVELDNERLRQSLIAQSQRVQDMADQLRTADEQANEDANEVIETPLPTADGDNAEAMLAWWNDYVVR